MLYLEFDFLVCTVSNNKLIMIKLIRRTPKSQPGKSFINNQEGMLGLTVDIHQKSFFLPFQSELFKKKSKTSKNPQTKTSSNQRNKIRIVSIK